MTTKLEWFMPSFLKRLRTRTGMTQPKLAKLCGFSRDDIANFERGLSRMSAGEAQKLYEALAPLDTTGEAHAAALAAAIATRKSMEHLLEDSERELVRQQSKLQAIRGWLTEAESNLERLKGKANGKSD
jgi:transcriptional regulator with XRE-family HTH domain